MAKVFLDTNAVIDILTLRSPEKAIHFEGHTLIASPLSIHIYLYTYKIKLPTSKLDRTEKILYYVPFSKDILEGALMGPTSDFEDNVQLHSAAEEKCDFFLTSDKKLLTMRFFGKTRIVPSLAESNIN